MLILVVFVIACCSLFLTLNVAELFCSERSARISVNMVAIAVMVAAVGYITVNIIIAIGAIDRYQQDMTTAIAGLDESAFNTRREMEYEEELIYERFYAEALLEYGDNPVVCEMLCAHIAEKIYAQREYLALMRRSERGFYALPLSYWARKNERRKEELIEYFRDNLDIADEMVLERLADCRLVDVVPQKAPQDLVCY